ncbi:MAG: NAD-glutamate dehydrogenase [Planctomycetota bacterium]|nr:NAD-glutamate dehydrogenase [Planctomycetota bacterium]MDA1105534.1 NAD-glutamate dehydrogenase [Planctomycetota bacterium]
MDSPATATPLDRARNPESVLEDLTGSLHHAAEKIVPWFVSTMPRAYFEDTSAQQRFEHLMAIISARMANAPLNLTLRGVDGSSMTAIRGDSQPGTLAEIVGSLPMDISLRAAKIHTSADGSLVIDTFEFGHRAPYDSADPEVRRRIEQVLAYAGKQHPELPADAVRAHAAKCSSDYLRTVTPLRFCRQMVLHARVTGIDAAIVELESESDPALTRLTMVVANARTRTMLERAAIVLARSGISIVRAYLDLIQDPPHGSVTLLGFVVQTAQGKALDPQGEQWKRASQDLLRVKWIDHRILLFQKRHSDLALDLVELTFAFANLVHQKLTAVNAFAFGRERIPDVLESYLPITREGLEVFVTRFTPGSTMPDDEFNARLDALRMEVERKTESENIATIIRTFLDAIAAVRRTNYFVQGRFGLSFRLDPSFLVGPSRPETPFGTYFVHGRGFNGFHVRFREIARGGLRVIRPTTRAIYERESERLYDEVYGLAYAQQQKNKDIPEGGAKCAILTEVPADSFRCIKAFVNSILDLITPDPDTRAAICDRLGTEEILYLGPDENITPMHIEWIVARARYRAFPPANAFMSSKPGAGINHKKYGVTSEGVAVFLREALLARGIDPATRPFTIKMTGGPDGDVAGNMIRILHRDYGENARIVGIADGSGTGEDPEGLDHAELLRLFDEELPIAAFGAAKLSPSGRIVPVDAPDGGMLRNTMHNRVASDAFVPSGGRPATINERNWRDYLLPDGRPSSGIIVEGANLFLTPGARVELSNRGCLIFKDSSANKGGVICSSYEIQSSMLMDEAAFKKIKPTYVAQVLGKLRNFALLEAQCLLAEARRSPHIPLPELCVKLSRAANDAADLVARALATAGPEVDSIRRSVVRQHIVPVLWETEGERVFQVLPRAYLDWMVAKSLASRIVYNEGVNFFSAIDADEVARIVVRYVTAEQELEQLLDALTNCQLADGARIAQLLKRSGTRAIALGG